MKLSTFVSGSRDENYQPLQTFFLVAVDTRMEDGSLVSGDRRSRSIHRAGTLRRVLKRVRRREPNAYMIKVGVFR